IALMVDQGTIDAGDRSLPLCEIELELERGNVADLFDVARELIRVLPARLAFKSKSERGYELIEVGPDTPAKAVTIDLLANMCTPHAFRMIGLACLKQVVDNVPALRATLLRSISTVNHTIVRHELSIPALRSLASGKWARGLHRSTSVYRAAIG